MKSPRPLISVLIVNFNGREHLGECLSSLSASTFQDFDIVLVDNASRDGSAEVVEGRFPDVKVVRSDINRGFAGGNNFGLPHCLGRYVYFLNNDTRVRQNTLEELARAVDIHPDVRIFASLLLDYRNPDRVDSAGDTLYTIGYSFSFAGYPASKFRRPMEITSACAGAALYERRLLDRIGGFDEDFFLNFEDMDLSFRARHAGERILLIPSSQVLHKGSATLGGKLSHVSLYYAERNFPLFVLKNFPLPNLLRLLPGLAYVKASQFYIALKSGWLGIFLKANLHTLLMAPRMFPKRRAILQDSVLGYRDFARLLRKNWRRETLALNRGDYSAPVQPDMRR